MYGSALFLATGSDAHIAAIVGNQPPRAHAKEEDVYRDAGLPFIAPELREGAGEIEAAREDRLPDLVAREEIRGDLQMHTHWSDGRYTVAQMAAACRERNYDYLAITDHSGSLTIANGLSPERLEEQWKEIDAARAESPGIAILKSSEVDILPDGSLDLPDDHLNALDCVLASVHVQQRMPKKEMTARILRAIQHPAVDILGHPTGKRGRRPPYEVELDVVLRACAELGVAVELDCSPDRTDLPADQIRRAIELGCTIAVDTDAHSIRELDYMIYGVGQARRAWAEPEQILNCLRWPAFRKWLQRRDRRKNLDSLDSRS
jgi:DNA polymerase (family 10)